ncbi:MAG: FG-GAP repeat domain-containing protein [Planctomycetota bacterium]
MKSSIRILLPLTALLLAGSLSAQGHDRWHQQFRVRIWNPVATNDIVHLDLADITGDGEPDLLYADPSYHSGGSRFDVGRVIVLDGVSGTPVFEQVGALRGGKLGTRARFLEDLDGDGVSDIAMTARSLGDDILHLFSGATGQRIGRELGYADCLDIISVGDHTGDGKAELVIARDNRATGHVLELVDGANGSVLKRRPVTEAFYINLVRLGDLDGDGLPEIGTYRPFSTAETPVQCEVLRGTNLRPLPMFTPEMTHATLLADAGDVDADGIPDILVGDYLTSSGSRFYHGELKVLSGATAAVLAHHVGLSGDRVGGLAKGLGDVNHDGHADYLVGSKVMDRGNGHGQHLSELRIISGIDHSKQDRFFARGNNANGDRTIAVSPATATDGPTFGVIDPKQRVFRPMITRLYLFTYGP